MMWTLSNTRNGDKIRFDEGDLCMAVFDLMKREGYRVSVTSPDGTIVNHS